MAELRIKVLRLPEAEAERETVIANLTEAQARAGAVDARYWVDKDENLLVITVPVTNG